MNRIEEHFQRQRAAGRKSLILFLTAGYPDMKTSVELVLAAAEAGADIIEFGVPFSDPIADGPTIQRASATALERGASLKRILDAVREIRKSSEVPLLLMGALNPFLRHGLEAVAGDAREAGVDGFIIPDLPPEESGEFEEICRGEELTLTHLIAPTSPPERRAKVARRSSGFVYYMTLKGVTGERTALAADLGEQVKQIQSVTDLPVGVGFGISTPEQVAEGARAADAVIVGSAAINQIREHEGKPDLLKAFREFVGALAEAAHGGARGSRRESKHG